MPKLEIRRPAFAGSFYPAAPGQLRGMIESFLEAAESGVEHASENDGSGSQPGEPAAASVSVSHPGLPAQPVGARVEAGSSSARQAKALIAPHAGYVYSGPVAASAFRQLSGREEIRRVLLLGPSHYCRFKGLAVSESSAFGTPLGNVEIDREAIGQLRRLAQVRPFEAAHEPEHCLEVELPFLQLLLSNFQIVPVLTGEASDQEVAQVVELLWEEPATLLVVSSDLSHFLDYPTAQQFDAQTAEAIEQLRPEQIRRESACGHLAIRGLLTAARRRGVAVRTLDLRNSGDTAGPRHRVVGYGAFALF